MKKPAKDTSIRVAAGKNVRKPKRTPRQASGKRIRLKKSRDKAAPDAVVAPEEPRAKTPSSDEALLAEAQALAHLGSWAWDIAADVVSWSDELYRIMGLEPQQCPVTYQVFLKCVHPEDRDCIHRVVQQSLSDHQPFSFDYRVILPSKAVRIQHGKGAVITDDRGRAARMHGTAQDITEQKQAAEDLRHSEQRFAAFMDNLPGFAWMKDVKGRYVYRNKRMMEIPGFRENWSGKTDADFWPPEVAAQYRANDLKVITSRASLQTVEYHPSDDRDRYVLVSKFPIFDQAGAVTMVAGAGVDVTERIQAEQARAQLAAIVESSNDAIIGQTFEGIISSWNAAAERIYGYTAAEILGQSLALLCPPEIPDPMPALRPRIKRAERIEDFETIRLRKDGSRLHVSVSLSPIKSATGEITGISAISRDITERKKIEKALESAEEQYHSIFNNAVEGIFRTSPDGKLLVANPAAARIFGFASPEESIEARQDIARQEYVDPLRREEFKRLLQEQGVVNGFEYEAYRKDGSRVWISENTHAVHSPSGEILYFEGIFEDVTERKQAEERLREYEKVVEGLEEMIVVVDRNYRYLLANRAFLNYRGLEREQCVGRSMAELLNEGVFENVAKKKLDECLQGRPVKYELRYRYPNRGERDLLISYLPIEGSAGVDRVACVLQDITERKIAEAALRDSETRFRQLAENIEEIFWITDLKGSSTIYISPAYERIAGRSGESLYAEPKSWRADIHPEDRPRMEATFASDPGSTGDYTYRIVRPDGSIRWIRDRGFPVRDESGEVVRFAGIAEDITASKLAEEELQRVNEQLRVLSRRLFQVQEDERRHLARELHDQIGQALTVTKISVQSAKRSKKREVIARHLDHTMAVLDQILVQVRQMTLDLRPAALDDLGLVPALRLVLHDHARSAGWQMQFLGDANLERADAEVETACFRITLEALTNILRHARARKVSLELCRTADSLHLIVRDDGVGFDLADAEKRVERDRLGLVGMRERATGVGGAFECRSVIGKGTEVHAFLPFNPV